MFKKKYKCTFFMIVLLTIVIISTYFFATWYKQKKAKENAIMKEEYIKKVEEKYNLTMYELALYADYYKLGCTQYNLIYEGLKPRSDGTIDRSKEFKFYRKNTSSTKMILEVYNYIIWDHPEEYLITRYKEDPKKSIYPPDSERTKQLKAEQKENIKKSREVCERYGFNSKNRITIDWVLENPYDAYHLIKEIPRIDFYSSSYVALHNKYIEGEYDNK